MCSGLHHARFLFKPEPLHYSVHKMIVRANRKISSVPVLKFQAINRRDDSSLNGFIRRYFSGYEEHQFRHCELAENHVHKTIKSDDEAEKEELVNLTQNSESDGRVADDSNGNGNSRGNGNKNGNGGDHGGDEGGQECNQNSQFPGIEWWMWWKWQQACSKTRYDSTQSSMWPVNAAIQAVANEVLEPAVHAVILKPIKQHIYMYRFILVLVFVAFIYSSIQMVAGLAIVSTSVSLAGLAVLVLVLTWWPCKQRGRQRQRNNEDDNGES